VLKDLKQMSPMTRKCGMTMTFADMPTMSGVKGHSTQTQPDISV